jgi:uncharacterized protein (TIGR02391 family)
MSEVTADLLRLGSTEEIAIAILRQQKGENATILGHNVVASGKANFKDEPDREALVNRLSDAYAWLVAHGCVGPAGSSGGWERVTRQGAALAANPNALLQLQADELLSPSLSPELLVSAKPAFVRGDYETAAFAAMKAVEVRVRELSGLSAGLVGVQLMKEAFKEGAPLADPSAEGGERVATMNLFAGAIGAFKNPASHRIVVFDDPLEAAEVVQLADLLLRMLNRVPPTQR